ncbi:PWWP domain-containing protein 1 [Typha latifolia]|uniref:PWWP domain-containing protein 1 n=1 Tax=Typha latifolia TaxID=4733 RepID=UPI003C2DFB1F
MATSMVSLSSRPWKKTRKPPMTLEIGTMVWGKVKSHPWWPGQVFPEALASPAVMATKKPNHILVAFFGDNSYGWFDPQNANLLLPFLPNLADLSGQTPTPASPVFAAAVNDAIDEIRRRAALGATCLCRRSWISPKPHSIPGCYTVEVPGHEPEAVYSVKQIEEARASFVPTDLVDFLRRLAISRTEMGVSDRISGVPMLMAYRREVYEEFDETYAQAFGAQPVRPPKRDDEVGPVEHPPPRGWYYMRFSISEKLKLLSQLFIDSWHSNLWVRVTTLVYISIAATFTGTPALSDRLDHPNTTGPSPSATAKKRRLVKLRDKTAAISSTISATSISQSRPLKLHATQRHFQGQLVKPKILSSCVSGELSPSKSATRKAQETASSLPAFLSSGSLDATVVVDTGKKSKTEANLNLESHTVEAVVDDTIICSGNKSSERKIINVRTTENVLQRDKVVSERLKENVSQREFNEQGDSVSNVVGTIAKYSGGTNQEASEVNDKVNKKEKGLKRQSINHILNELEGSREATKRKIKMTGSKVDKGHHKGSRLLDSKGSKLSGAWNAGHSHSPQQTKVPGSTQLKLPQLVNDLSAPTTDPLFGSEWNIRSLVSDTLCKFQSLVYNESLVLLKANDIEKPKFDAGERSTANESAQALGAANVKGSRKEERGKRAQSSAKMPVKPNDYANVGKRRKPDQKEELSIKNQRSMTDYKKLASRKKAGEGEKNVERVRRRDRCNLFTPTASVKHSKVDISKNEISTPHEPANPTSLVMKFPPNTSLPSVSFLKAKFARFGPLDVGATRVYWDSNTCKIKFMYKSHAQTALYHASANGSFGSNKATCYLKECHSPAKEPSMICQDQAFSCTSIDAQPLEPRTGGCCNSLNQMKTCYLKEFYSSAKEPQEICRSQASSCSFVDAKPFKPGTEGGGDNSCDQMSTSSLVQLEMKQHSVPLKSILKKPINTMSPNVNGSDVAISRVAFSLENEHDKSEQLANIGDNKNDATTIDISAQMLSLLMKCNDIVTRIKSSYGYMPYHKL